MARTRASKKRPNSEVEEEDDNGSSTNNARIDAEAVVDESAVSRQILEALKCQNDLLKTQNETLRTHTDALKTQNDALQTQTASLRTQIEVLKGMDTRLLRIEQQTPGKHQRQRRGCNIVAQSRPHDVIYGTWTFVESAEVARRKEQKERERQEREKQAENETRHLGAVEKQQRARERLLAYQQGNLRFFGLIEDDGLVLLGEKFPPPPFRGHDNSIFPSQQPEGCITGYLQPAWSGGVSNLPVHDLLPVLAFNGETELKQKSGIFSLTVTHNCSTTNTDRYPPNLEQEAAIIVGQIAFSNDGCAMAEGADWDRLLSNQRQTQLPYSHGARGLPQWQSRKISEPWEDGVELTFRIDNNENTIVYKKGDTPEKVFWNTLAFTNNRNFPDFLRVFAYCGGGGKVEDLDMKLTFLNDRPG